MQANAFKNIVVEFPTAPIIIELKNGQRIKTTGFWLRADKNNNPIVIIKAGKKLKG